MVFQLAYKGKRSNLEAYKSRVCTLSSMLVNMARAIGGSCSTG
jgi:hypothetical protein